MTREIPLTQGFVALVDDADFEQFGGGRWYAAKIRRHVYAARCWNKRTEFLHRAIMQPAAGLVVDHISGDGLDNRRTNLRVCTHQQNMRNQVRKRSLPKGVCRIPPNAKGEERFICYIMGEHRRICLGSFGCPIEAGRAYDAAALIHHGEFARLNFPEAA
jgi:hypothetical protein